MSRNVQPGKFLPYGECDAQTMGMKLSAEQVAERMAGVADWAVERDAIRRQFVFDGFASAIAFVVRVGFDAEAADHHPDVAISNYRKVTLTFTTHSAGGLTAKDFAGAEAADRIFSGGFRQAGA
jgi:4a-hydroxytetrahydrobiopterin dehydratase